MSHPQQPAYGALADSICEEIRALKADLSTTRQQLLAAQVDNQRLRDALTKELGVWKYDREYGESSLSRVSVDMRIEAITKALATPPDLSALSLHDANERKEGAREALEKAANWFSTNYTLLPSSEECAEVLRRMLAELDQAPQGEKL